MGVMVKHTGLLGTHIRRREPPGPACLYLERALRTRLAGEHAVLWPSAQLRPLRAGFPSSERPRSARTPRPRIRYLLQVAKPAWRVALHQELLVVPLRIAIGSVVPQHCWHSAQQLVRRRQRAPLVAAPHSHRLSSVSCGTAFLGCAPLPRLRAPSKHVTERLARPAAK